MLHHEIKDLNSVSPATGARTGQGAASIQQLNCFTLVKQWKMSVGALPTVSLWVTSENDTFIVLERDYFNNPRTFGRITENSVCVNAIHTSIRFRLSIHINFDAEYTTFSNHACPGFGQGSKLRQGQSDIICFIFISQVFTAHLHHTTLSHIFINFRLHTHTQIPCCTYIHAKVHILCVVPFTLVSWNVRGIRSQVKSATILEYVTKWKVAIVLRKHIYKNQKKGTGSNWICPFQLVIIVNKEVCLSCYICSNRHRRSIYNY